MKEVEEVFVAKNYDVMMKFLFTKESSHARGTVDKSEGLGIKDVGY